MSSYRMLKQPRSIESCRFPRADKGTPWFKSADSSVVTGRKKKTVVYIYTHDLYRYKQAKPQQARIVLQLTDCLHRSTGGGGGGGGSGFAGDFCLHRSNRGGGGGRALGFGV